MKAQSLGIAIALSSGYSCFVAGTPVWTDKGLVPIEKIQVGDMVLSQPQEGGERAYKQVTKTFKNDGQEVVLLSLFDSKYEEPRYAKLIVTRNHPFWVNGKGWTPVEKLGGGEELQLSDGSQCQVFEYDALFATTVDEVAWRDGDCKFNSGSGLGPTIDMRNNSIVFCDELVPNDEIDVGNFGSLFITTVYNIEVEDNHTYYVGQWGFWVRHSCDST